MNYYVRKSADADIQGPLSVEEIKLLLAEGGLSDESLATADLGEGLERIANAPKNDWSKLNSIGDLVGHSPDFNESNHRALEANAEISFGRRFGFVVIAWVLTAVATYPGIMYPPAFPAGLFVVFGMGETNPLRQWWIIIGWIVYFTLTFAALLSRRENRYFIIFALLCVLLLLNSAGCRVMMTEFKDIH
ncbi:MAG: hypothetical protein AAB370_10375 [Verrucomicrobiota bacterium]